MTTVAGLSASNAHNISVENNKRGATIVRVCGEEHSASSVGGTAVTYIAHDNDMCFVSDYKFKLVLGVGATDQHDPWGPTYSEIIHGTATWPTLKAFQQQYPLNSYIDVDKAYGAQCYDYINAYWLGQVNRSIRSNNNATGIWDLRQTNAGNEFALITSWSALRPGDWIIWSGPASTGHVAMAVSYPSGNNIMVYGQNQINPNYITGHSLSKMAANSSYFRGAFRYRGWDVGDCTGDNNVERDSYNIA